MVLSTINGHFYFAALDNLFIYCSDLPAPIATDSSGFWLKATGTEISAVSHSSIPFNKEPPPVNMTPRSTMSPLSSAGLSSSVALIASKTCNKDSLIASLISYEERVMVFGRPVTRSRPLASISFLHDPPKHTQFRS